MARIYKPKGSSFWWTDTRGLPGGKRQATGTKDENLAKAILGDRIRDNDDGTTTGTMSYKAAEELYLTHRKGKNRKTYQASRLALQEFREICSLATITRTYPEHLRRFRDYLRHERKSQGNGAGHAQANKLFREVLKFIAYCEDEEWIEPQRWSKVDKPYPDTKPRKFRFTPAQMEAIFSKYPAGWIGTTVRLGYYAAMRRGEIFHLQVGDLDFTRKIVVLPPKRHWRVKAYGDNDPPQTIPMDDTLAYHLKQILKSHKTAQQSNDKVISGSPKNMEDMSREITKALHAVEDPDTKQKLSKGSLHTLRHTIIGHLLDAGQSPAKVQRFARHKKIQQTLDYADVSDEAARDVLNGIPVKEGRKK